MKHSVKRIIAVGCDWPLEIRNKDTIAYVYQREEMQEEQRKELKGTSRE